MLKIERNSCSEIRLKFFLNKQLFNPNKRLYIRITKLVLTFIILTVTSISFSDTTIHISTSGDDTASGTAQAPIRNLNHLWNLFKERMDITEIIFHEGVYRGGLIVTAPSGMDPETAVKKLPPLIIRVAKGEKAIIDGAQPLGKTKPVEGWTGVYLVENPLLYRSNYSKLRLRLPNIWDRKARKRYMLVADEQSVRRFPASFCFTKDAMYIHTSDGLDPSKHSIEVSLLNVSRNGIELSRPNTTVKGLSSRNFFLDCNYSAGFGVHGENVTLEDCYVSNCPRGFGVYGPGTRIIRCHVDDCGCGAHVKYRDALVKDSQFFKIRDDFMVPMSYQEDSGIEVYHNAEKNVVISGNICRGYGYYGIFIKARPGMYLIENNTLINNTNGIGHWQTHGADVICRNNVIYGSYSLGIQAPDKIYSKLKANRNCIWPGPWSNPKYLQPNLKYLNSVGKGNFMSDPRIANPLGEELFLLPDSPCIGRDSTGKNIGAIDTVVTKDFKDTIPPAVRLHPLLSELKIVDGEFPLFLAGRQEFQLRIMAHDSMTRPTKMKVQIGHGEWSQALPYKENYTIHLPEQSQPVKIAVSVSDQAGNWSESAIIRVQTRLEEPRLVGQPTVRTNKYGVVISFRTNVECYAQGEYGLYNKDGKALRVSGSKAQGQRRETASFSHALGAVIPNTQGNGKYYYKIRLEDDKGKQGQVIEGEFQLQGPTREWYISADGENDETGGTAENPWATLQYGVDRALPGDTVVIMPGIYTGSTLMVRGGFKDAPITIKSMKKWEAVFDGHHRVNTLLTLTGASYVELIGLEFRWYGDPNGVGIRLDNSPNITVRNCKIWNAFWNKGRVMGTGIVGKNSPGFVLEKSLIFKNDRALELSRCPKFKIVYNTIRGHVHGGLYFDESVAGSILRNNDLTFNGNDICKFYIVDPIEMDSFDSDYNNLGTNLRYWRDEPGVVPNLTMKMTAAYSGGSKALMMFVRKGGTWLGLDYTKRKWVPDATTPPKKRGQPYFRLWTFEDWKKFSGKDVHSIFADPRYADINGMDFRLQPDSPNIGAGENGTTIGAMEVHGKKAKD